MVRSFACRSEFEGVDDDPPAERQRVGDMDHRGEVYVGPAVAHKPGHARIERRILARDRVLTGSGLAAELGLVAASRTTLMTTNGSTPASRATTTVVFGAIRAENIEVLTASLDALSVVDRDVRGVLGQDILRRSSWLVDYRRGVVDQDLELWPASRAGARLPLKWSAGRPTVAAVFDDGEPVNLVLDSAANGLVLFAPHATHASRGSMRMRSLEVEAEVPIVAAATLRVGPVLFDRPRAGLVVRSDYEPGEGGLLPTSMFEAIYFDRARNEAVVVARR